MELNTFYKKDSLESSFLYLATIAFHIFLVGSAMAFQGDPKPSCVNIGVIGYLAALTVEFMFRDNGARTRSFYISRYHGILTTGLLSITGVVLSYQGNGIGLLTPLLLYRIYHEFFKTLRSLYATVSDVYLLVLGAGSTPLAVYLGVLPIGSSMMFIYAAVALSIVVSFIREDVDSHLLLNHKSNKAMLFLNNESMEIARGMVSDAMEILKRDVYSIPPSKRCSWYLTIVNSMGYVDNLLSESTKNPDLNRFVSYLDRTMSPEGPRVSYAGWKHDIRGENTVVVLAIVKYFVGVSSVMFKGKDIEDKTVWVTNTQNRVSVKDNSGGMDYNRLTPKDVSFIKAITSSNFYKEYGVRVHVSNKKELGADEGLEVIIVF